MKLIIEIDDEALRSAVQAQVGQAVAAMATAELEKQVQEIINKKFDRINITDTVNYKVEAMLRGKLDGLITDVVGGGYDRSTKVRNMINDAIRQVVKESLK